MARRRQARRGAIDPVPWIVAVFAGAVFLVSLMSPHPPRSDRVARFTMEEARAFNADVPFVRRRAEPAEPFRFHGTVAARTQAIECLATAAVYEAGSDKKGQMAVIQVVLNRVRLRWFPHTVCGVVYEGSARPTGCQFSFTCDGSRTRRPEHQGWGTARSAAKRALGGYVFAPVGKATQYHTESTVPYWIGSFDKIAQVRSHIFYRIKGARPASSPTSI